MASMSSLDIDENLREQSKLLLRKLKAKQGRLQNIVQQNDDSIEQPTSETFLKEKGTHNENASSLTNVKEQLDSSLMKSGRQATKNVRSRLHQRSKSKEEKENINLRELDHCERNTPKTASAEETFAKEVLDERQFELENLRAAVNKSLRNEKQDDVPEKHVNGNDVMDMDKGKETPNNIRRRRIIDRNVRVEAPTYLDMNASTLIRECEDGMPRLNYSYTDIDDNDLEFLQKRLGTNSGVDDVDGDMEETEEEPVKDTGAEYPAEHYSENLENPGNNRKFAKFIRDVKKPKSILLSNSHRSNKSSTGNSSKVSFRSPTRDSSSRSYQMDSMSKHNQKMMGYDWIAALLDNDSQAVNQSETFFEELKEFRKVNLDECVNDLYMQGPMELWEHPEREPSPVQQALEETKVKPFTVNERLFPEPIKRSLFAQYDYEEPTGNLKKEKEGTYEEPRFCRVSIPRSTLLAPHQVKPHRRNSFDAADTMSLSRHCLKGWNTSQPSMMPTASNIALRNSTMGIKASLKTTLHDAETLAANYPYEWNSSDQSISRPVIKPTYRPENNYSNGTWPYNLRDSTNPSYTEASSHLQRATDDLLNSTYSLMYEMKRLKNDRSDHPLRV